MSELSPEAAALVRAGRTAFRPEASDRERMLQSLTNTLGPGALLGGAPHAHLAKSAAGARLLFRGWVLGGLGALAVGAALVVASHAWMKMTPASGPAPVSSAMIPAVLPEPVPATPTDVVQAPAQRVSDAPRPSSRSPLARPSSDSLAEEVRLLSKAEQQLYAGHADDALKVLGEHERRFPNGELTEQRLAAQAQSLCTLGRIADARADLTKLARAYPRSPQLDRARKFCGIDTP